jgi:hypothetical protein
MNEKITINIQCLIFKKSDRLLNDISNAVKFALVLECCKLTQNMCLKFAYNKLLM